MARLFASFGNIFSRGTLILKERVFADLPDDPHTGEIANVSDSTVSTVGQTVAGGSTNHVLAKFDGSVWKVIG